MHPNNNHINNYDLDSLMKNNPSLEKFVFVNNFDIQTIEFSDPLAVKALNSALLKDHYQINYWNFPKENLCPPIPSRVDYLHYLADLLEETKIPSEYKEKNTVLDIGTGATCIYPLLGVSKFKWNFVATDCEVASLRNAKKIIEQNEMQDNITLKLQSDKSIILKGIVTNEDTFMASICNPPFYASARDAMGANSRKRFNLSQTTSERNFKGTQSELWYEGGEKAFLHNYLYESSLHKKRCVWYTSLVSKKDNVKSMEASLKKLKATSFKVIPMKNGNKVSRIVAWSFMI